MEQQVRELSMGSRLRGNDGLEVTKLFWTVVCFCGNAFRSSYDVAIK
jgi:hypothetical protein